LNRIRRAAGVNERFEAEPETAVPSMAEQLAKLETWVEEGRPRLTAWARLLVDL
jgi:hypothetical protein